MTTEVDELRLKKEKIFKYIKKIKDTDFYKKIYNIIKDTEKYTKNKNGIFLDVNKLTEKSTNSILLLIDNIKQENNIDSTTEDSITYKPYSKDSYEQNVESLGGVKKLNNFEKNIIKKISMEEKL